MRAVVLTRHGGYDALQVQERPDPAPGPGQVLVDVRAAGVNFADHMARQGLYDDAPDTPCVLGYEVAGVVASVGEGVTSPAPGDRVMAATRFGGYASRVVAGADDCVPLPDGLSFAEGAAIPVNYATAWAGLVGFGSLRAGERVLIHAGRAGSASPPPRSRAATAPRCGGPRRRPSTSASARSACSTRSTTAGAAGIAACRRST